MTNYTIRYTAYTRTFSVVKQGVQSVIAPNALMAIRATEQELKKLPSVVHVQTDNMLELRKQDEQLLC